MRLFRLFAGSMQSLSVLLRLPPSPSLPLPQDLRFRFVGLNSGKFYRKTLCIWSDLTPGKGCIKNGIARYVSFRRPLPFRAFARPAPRPLPSTPVLPSTKNWYDHSSGEPVRARLPAAQDLRTELVERDPFAPLVRSRRLPASSVTLITRLRLHGS